MMRFIQIIVCLLITSPIFSQAFQKIGQNELPKNIKINCFTADRDALWLGCDNGIYRVIISTEGVVTDLSVRNTSRPVLALLNDGGNLWSALEEKGLYLFDKKSYQFKGVQSALIRGNDIVCIEKSADRIQLLSKKGKVFQFLLSDTAGVELPLWSKEISGNILNKLQGFAHNDFLEISNRGVVLNGSTLKNVPFDFVENIVLLDKTSIIAVGSDLWKVDTVSKQFKKYNLSVNFVDGSFYEVGDKRFFICESGVLQYDQTKDTLSFSNSLDVLTEDESNGLVNNLAREVITESNETDRAKNDGDCNKSVTCDTGSSCSTGFILLVAFGFVFYSIVLIFLVSRKYKKDIYIIEEELLRLKQQEEKV